MSQSSQKPGPGDLRARLGLKPTAPSGRGEAGAPAQPAGPTATPAATSAGSSLRDRLSPRPANQPPVQAPQRPTGDRITGEEAAGPGPDDLFGKSPQSAAVVLHSPTGQPLVQPPPEMMAGLEEEMTRPAQFSPGFYPPAPGFAPLSPAPATGFPPPDAPPGPGFPPPGLVTGYAPAAEPQPPVSAVSAALEEDPLALLTAAPPIRPPAPQVPEAPAFPGGLGPAPYPQPPQPAPAPDPFAAPFAGQPTGPALYGQPPAPYFNPLLAMDTGPAPALPPSKTALIKVAAITGVAAALIALVVGYMIGGVGKDREIKNRRIADAQTLLNVLQVSVDKVREMVPKLEKLDPEKPDFELATSAMGFTCALELEKANWDHLLLGRAITSDLLRYQALAADLQERVRRHAYYTTKKHKAHLDKILEVNKTLQSGEQILVSYTPNARPNMAPPLGHLVELAGEQVVEGREIRIPVRPMSNPTVVPVDINFLIMLDRRELLSSAGPNALALHSERVTELKNLATEVTKAADRVLDQVKKEAGKERVSTF